MEIHKIEVIPLEIMPSFRRRLSRGVIDPSESGLLKGKPALVLKGSSFSSYLMRPNIYLTDDPKYMEGFKSLSDDGRKGWLEFLRC
jgi:hypothetical protein